MKKIYIAVVACLLSACQGLYFDNPVGKTVRFRATMADNGLTRTSYSGVVTEDKERIDWAYGDKVAVYMYWEQQKGNEAIADPASKHRLVYDVTPGGTHSAGHQGASGDWMDHGTLQAKDGDFTWKGDTEEGVLFDHYFYSTYPDGPKLDYKTPENVTITFGLPQNNADNMQYAYMAAAAKSIQTKHNSTNTDSHPYEGTIDLNYYPMVTTLFVTLVNSSSKTDSKAESVIVKISPSPNNHSNPLFGDYTAKLQDGRFVTNDIATGPFSDDDFANNSTYTYTFPEGSKQQSKSVPFFIRPRKYNRNDVTLTVGSKSYPLNIELEPCHKYNITVNLKDGQLGIQDLSPGGAQLFVAALSVEGIGDQNAVWNFLKDFYSAHPELGIKDGNDFNNKIWNDDFQKLKNSTTVTYDDLVKVFGGKEAVETLIKEMQKKEDFSKLQQKTITRSITAKDLKILFPEAKTLYIQTADSVKVSIDGLPKLETITLMNIKDVEINNCEKLTKLEVANSNNLNSIDIENCILFDELSANIAGKLKEIKLINTPKFRIGSIQNVNNTVDVTLIDCSTQITSGATLSLNGKGNIIKKENSNNVTVK